MRMMIIVAMFMVMSLYAKELPKSALLEKYLLAAKMYENKGEYKKAIKNFEKIEELHISLPKEFFYRYAINLYYDKRYEKSRTYFTEYITRATRKDKYYKSALKYLILLDDDENKEKKRQKRCKALPDIINTQENFCEDFCEREVYKKIDANLNNYDYTTTEMYNAWYPECMKVCDKKKVQPLYKEFRRKCRSVE